MYFKWFCEIATIWRRGNQSLCSQRDRGVSNSSLVKIVCYFSGFCDVPVHLWLFKISNLLWFPLMFYINTHFWTYFELGNLYFFFLMKAHKIKIFRPHTTWISLCNYPISQKISSVGIYSCACSKWCVHKVIQCQIVCNRKGFNSVDWTDWVAYPHNRILYSTKKWEHT